MFKTILFLLLYPFLSSAELDPGVNLPPVQTPAFIEAINELDQIKSQLPFDSRKKISWDIKDIVILVRVQVYGEDSTLKALRKIENSARDYLLSYQEQEEVFRQARGPNYPTWRNPLKSKDLKDSSISVGGSIGGVSFSATVPLVASTQLNDDEKAELIRGLKELRDIYDSPDLSTGQRYIIAKFFDEYLDFDINKTSEEILTENDGMATEYKAFLAIFQNNIEGLNNGFKLHVDEALGGALESESKIIYKQSRILGDKVASEARALVDIITQANSGQFEQLADANEKLDYLKKKQIENEVIQRISNITNADDLEKMIVETKVCDQSDFVNECAVLKEKITVMEAKLSKLRQVDIRATTKRGLRLAHDLALLTDDKKTADYIAKTIQGYEAVVDISDLAIGLAAKTAMASAGDVMSMASLAISVVNLFDSAGGPSADEIILEQLRQIRLEIEDVRKQMHERFDDLSLQIRHLGLGLNLKLDTIGDNIAVIADNQTLIKELIVGNSFMIANLVQVQSDNTISQIANRLDSINSEVSVWKGQGQISNLYVESLTKFSSFIKFNNFDGLRWPRLNDGFEISSTEALQLTANVNSHFSQADYATFGLIDYLIKNSINNKLGGECSKLNFNNVYLFNVLGSQVLETLRAKVDDSFSNLNGTAKYNYVLNSEDISRPSLYDLYDQPIKSIDSILQSASRCLNNFATKVDSDALLFERRSVNFITYLLELYSKELDIQLAKVKKMLTPEFHLTALHRAIQNPDSDYFKDSMRKLTNVNSQFPERRVNFELQVLDFSKPLEEHQQYLDQIFYEKYKNINLCERSKLLITNKEIYKKVKFDPASYSSVELPKSLLHLIFPQPEMRAALALALNTVNLCYTPTTWMYLPFLQPKGVEFRVEEKFNSMRSHKFSESIQGMTISIDSIENVEVQAESEKDRNHPSVKVKTATSKVDIYFPSKDILLSQFDPVTINYQKNIVDLSQETLPKSINLWYLNLDSSEFSRYISEKFNDADWACKSNEVTNFTDQCFVKGYKPSGVQLDFENSTSNEINSLHEGRHTYTNKLYEGVDVDKSNELRSQLRAESLQKSYDVIQQDYLKCYYRSLLGLPNCYFSGVSASLVPEKERVDWTKLNQLESILRSLVPKFAEFSKGVERSQKLRFNSMFDQLLKSPSYKIVNLTQDNLVSPKLFYSYLETEFKTQGQGFPELLEQSEGLLKVDVQKLLNMEVYEGLKYYQELSK